MILKNNTQDESFTNYIWVIRITESRKNYFSVSLIIKFCHLKESTGMFTNGNNVAY